MGARLSTKDCEVARLSTGRKVVTALRVVRVVNSLSMAVGIGGRLCMTVSWVLLHVIEDFR